MRPIATDGVGWSVCQSALETLVRSTEMTEQIETASGGRLVWTQENK